MNDAKINKGGGDEVGERAEVKLTKERKISSRIKEAMSDHNRSQQPVLS